MAGGYSVILAIPFARDFFELELFSDPAAWTVATVATLAAGVGIVAVSEHTERFEAVVRRLVGRSDP
jgi:hypothetical protein